MTHFDIHLPIKTQTNKKKRNSQRIPGIPRQLESSFWNIIQISSQTHNSVFSFIAAIKQMVLLSKCYFLAINSVVILDCSTPL